MEIYNLKKLLLIKSVVIFFIAGPSKNEGQHLEKITLNVVFVQMTVSAVDITFKNIATSFSF